MQRPAVALLLIVSLLASGCLSSQGSLGSIPEGRAPDGADAGSAADHGAADRATSDVTVEKQGDQYVARRTVTLSNDFGGASQSSVALKTDNGGVAARAWSNGGYKVVVLQVSRSTSEATARSGLDLIRVEHSDRLASGTLTLDTHAIYPSSCGSPAGPCLSAGITANLPAEPAYRLDLEADNGGATVSGLGGPSAEVLVDNGGISIDGAFARILATADNGGIEIVGVANDVDARADNGGVAVVLSAEASGTWDLSVENGGVTVSIDRDGDVGVDATATADNGGVSIRLQGGETVGEATSEHKHVRTAGASTSDILVTIQASADNGGVEIDD